MPVFIDPLLLRHDHSPGRNEQNVPVARPMKFRLYNPDSNFGIDDTTFKVRFNAGVWYEYGNSRLTFTTISAQEHHIYFNPPAFEYDTEINVELYCGDDSGNPGILLEIL